MPCATVLENKVHNNNCLFHSPLAPQVWRIWVSEQCTFHTLSKHNAACLRTALGISNFAQPWYLAQCSVLQVSRTMVREHVWVTQDGRGLGSMNWKAQFLLLPCKTKGLVSLCHIVIIAGVPDCPEARLWFIKEGS